MQSLKILKQQVAEKSQGVVALELNISKTTINLVLKEKYPNPKNIYKKILDKYGNGPIEIVGVDTNESAIDLFKEIINGT